MWVAASSRWYKPLLALRLLCVLGQSIDFLGCQAFPGPQERCQFDRMALDYVGLTPIIFAIFLSLGSKLHVADQLRQAAEIGLWRQAHGSIMVREPQPNF